MPTCVGDSELQAGNVVAVPGPPVVHAKRERPVTEAVTPSASKSMLIAGLAGWCHYSRLYHGRIRSRLQQAALLGFIMSRVAYLGARSLDQSRTAPLLLAIGWPPLTCCAMLGEARGSEVLAAAFAAVCAGVAIGLLGATTATAALLLIGLMLLACARPGWLVYAAVLTAPLHVYRIPVGVGNLSAFERSFSLVVLAWSRPLARRLRPPESRPR